MVSLPVLRRQPSGAARATLPGDPVFPRGYAAVVYGCGASLSALAVGVDDARALRRALRSVPSDGVSLAPKNENPTRASQRGGSREPSVECIEIISCYEG